MRITNMVMILFVLIALTGCEAITGNKGGPPNPFYFGMITDCGGEPTAINGLYIGTYSYMYVDFYTGNVNDDFDASILIDSPSVAPADRPATVVKTVTYSTVKTNPNSASGVKRAAFYVYAPCYSDGPYTITFIITDPHGDSGYYSIGFDVWESFMYANDACKCVSQCGECKMIRYTLEDRCSCGCQLYSEKCD